MEFGRWTARTARDVYSPEHKLTAAEIRELSTDPNHHILLTSTLTVASTTKEYSVSLARGTGTRNAVIEIGKNGCNYAALKYSVNWRLVLCRRRKMPMASGVLLYESLMMQQCQQIHSYSFGWLQIRQDHELHRRQYINPKDLGLRRPLKRDFEDV
ncbi:hypothetical protein GCM10010924_53210 [Rhizobium wenxiniae]|nr:hypothetical protein GCM10010924_53210 [Rhizobium wenxiniae]